MLGSRVALAVAQRYGNTPAWRAALRIVDRAQDQLRDLWLYLYEHDGQRIAREAVRETEKAEAGKQALSDISALIARLSAKERVEIVPTPEDAERFRQAGLVLGRKVIDDMLLRGSTGKKGRN
jgi:hypothetical protein